LQAGYHWTSGKAVVGYHDTIHVYFRVLVNSLLAHHPYFTLEVLLSLIGGWSLLKLCKKQEAPYTDRDYRYFQLAFLMLTVYTTVALIPFPPYEQYFTSPLVPFLLPFVAEGLRVALVSWRRRVPLLALAVPILFAGEISRETMTNSQYSWCQLSSYRKVAEAIKSHSSPDDVVLSFWPGYVFESGRRYFPGMEDHFVYRITSRISPEARARYHVVSKDQVTRAVSTGAVSTLIIGAWMGEYYENLSPSEIQGFHAAVRANYSLVSRIGDVAIYQRSVTGVR
jgi:hypothetical protein